MSRRRPPPALPCRAAALALLLAPAPAAALSLDLPGGATLALEAVEDPGSHRLATGPAQGGPPPTRVAEGRVTRQAWQVPSGDDGPAAATLALMAPLRAQVEAQGLTILLDCEAEACGGFDFRAGVEVLPPPAMFVDLSDFRYLAAEGEGVALSLLVSRSDRLGFVQAVEVGGAPARSASGAAPAPEAAPAALPPAALPPAALPPAAPLPERLEAEGRAVISGLAFAPGSAEPAGGEADLEALAAWLAQDPARRVAIVGHTDATGPLDANIALSRRRAEAVAERLLALPGVRGAQVESGGMGYLAPLASNLTEAGRALNRRVEAVALPPR